MKNTTNYLGDQYITDNQQVISYKASAMSLIQ
jgi:hypothetical protein